MVSPPVLWDKSGYAASRVLTLLGQVENVFQTLAIRPEWYVRPSRCPWTVSNLRASQRAIIVEFAEKPCSAARYERFLSYVENNEDCFREPREGYKSYSRTFVLGWVLGNSPPPSDRLFWCVTVGRRVDIKALRADLDALYAEAKHRYLLLETESRLYAEAKMRRGTP